MDAKLRELHDRALKIAERADELARALLADRFLDPQSVNWHTAMPVYGQALIMALLEHEDEQKRSTAEALP